MLLWERRGERWRAIHATLGKVNSRCPRAAPAIPSVSNAQRFLPRRWPQGCVRVPRQRAPSGGTLIGARKGDRSIICPARRCSVDSDAVLLRARHGGRHEGGGRRQRKRDEELVHLAMVFCNLEMACADADSANWQCSSPLRKTRNKPSGDLQSNFRTPGVHLRQREVQIWDSARRATRHAVLSVASPHAIAA